MEKPLNESATRLYNYMQVRMFYKFVFLYIIAAIATSAFLYGICLNFKGPLSIVVFCSILYYFLSYLLFRAWYEQRIIMLNIFCGFFSDTGRAPTKEEIHTVFIDRIIANNPSWTRERAEKECKKMFRDKS